jgi:hypothetical protein
MRVGHIRRSNNRLGRCEKQRADDRSGLYLNVCDTCLLSIPGGLLKWYAMLPPVKAKTVDIPIRGSVRQPGAASGSLPIMRLPGV